MSGLPVLRDDIRNAGLAPHCLQKLLDEFRFETVLDIGGGQARHSDVFRAAGKDVTVIDMLADKNYVSEATYSHTLIVADYNQYEFTGQSFDCIWCSHVLEHQLNAHAFLCKIFGDLARDGILAITVPPLKHSVVGGHVSLWNAGLLLYNLVLAGFDCRDARVLTHDYNISVIVEKSPVDILDAMVYGHGDILTIKPYLPRKIDSKAGQDFFDGNISALNW